MTSSARHQIKFTVTIPPPLPPPRHHPTTALTCRERGRTPAEIAARATCRQNPQLASRRGGSRERDTVRPGRRAGRTRSWRGDGAEAENATPYGQGDVQAEPAAGVETARKPRTRHRTARATCRQNPQLASRRRGSRERDTVRPGRRADGTRSWRRDGASYLMTKTETGAC